MDIQQLKIEGAARAILDEFLRIEAIKLGDLPETYTNRQTGETQQNHVFISVAALRALKCAVANSVQISGEHPNG